MPTWFDGLTTTATPGRTLVIGEVAQAHDGSLGMAHAFIDAIARTGADAVKFQTHVAAAESTSREPWRVPLAGQDASRFDYWKRMEFTEAQWAGLAGHAASVGLMFLSSPFSVEALDLLRRIGVPAWKVASGEAAAGPLLDRMLDTRLPLLVSTGLSSVADLDRLVSSVRARDVRFVLMQCTSAYPCPFERVGLNLIAEFRHRYACPVGLSDHSGTIYPSLAAVALGARALEVHVTLSREMFGPDVPASVSTAELRQIVEGVRAIDTMLANPVDKNTAATDAAPLRALFTKSLVARTDLAAGTRLEAGHLAFKKPGNGLPPSDLPRIVGHRLRRDMAADDALQLADLEWSEG